MEHRDIHAIVELVNVGGKSTVKVTDVAEKANMVAKAISASQAFRQYNWLTQSPVKNVAGNLRGMVVSAKWNTAFQFTVKAGDVLGKVSAFVTIAVAMAESSSEIEDILNSNDPWNLKGARLSTQVTGIAMKYLTGIVTAPVHMVMSSMPAQYICSQIDQANGYKIGSFGGCQSTLNALDASIQSAAQTVSDGNQIYVFVNTTINPTISKALGM
jgi:hypothetical protein